MRKGRTLLVDSVPMSRDDLPSLQTYIGIFKGIISTSTNNCSPWAQPLWAVDAVFFFCLLATLFYLYILGAIIYVTKRQNRFRSPFHLCMIVLAIGDIVTIVSTSREGVTQTCVLGQSAARHLAWESIGAFSMDLIIAVNLVISVVRLVGVSSLSSNSQGKYSSFLLILLLLAVLWSFIIAFLHYFGVVKRIWFDPEIGYRDEFFFPFTHFRTILLFGELGLSFLIYLLAAYKLQKIKTNIKDLKKEFRLLLLAFLIFVSELFYVYSANWVGYNYFGWGSGEFNANLNYFARPLSAGITPVFYLLFSSEIRHAALFCRRRDRSKALVSTIILFSKSVFAADCPNGAVYDASFNRALKSFGSAEDDCAFISGHLVSIQNGFENGLVAGTAPTYFGQTTYWIGAQNTGSWSWTDGTPFSYSNWGVGQPDSSKPCAFTDTTNYKWRTEECKELKPYVCVIPQEVPTTLGPCPTTAANYGGYCDDGWIINRSTDSCYKTFFNKTFSDSESFCKSQGAHLTSIHSASENSFILGLTSTGLKLESHEMTWIGLKKNGLKGWQWTDETKTDYLNWEEGEPENIPLLEENCATLISDPEKLKAKAYTFWRNLHCSKAQRAFVCKKTALH